MDYRMDDFFRMQQTGGYKMPFYMTYPMQSLYMTEMEYERDRERMKEMYPAEAGKIQRAVEEECDKMEYDGSLMFDEYPDRLMLRRICNNIYQNVYENTEDVAVTQYGRPGPPPPPPGPHGPRRGIQDMIEVLLYNEMYRRRCRHNRCRRWW